MKLLYLTKTMTIRTELQQKAQNTLLQYAFFRWENAVLIALTLILTFLDFKPFGLAWWPAWAWIVIGALGVAAIVFMSLNDAKANAKLLTALFQEQFNPRDVKDRDLRRQIENALEYQRRIEEQIERHKEGLMRDRLEDTANQISDWIRNVYQLALRLDAYRQDDLLEREQQLLPKEVQQLAAQRKLESNPNVQKQLDEVLDSKRQHWNALQELDTRMKQAELQLDQSVTALATIYSQVQLIDAQSVASGRAERLQSDIRDQVNRLNDLVSSISEVYNYNTKGIG
ncbi:MAG: hypothetical protein KDE54_30385 [Caldilineaceae bacterium]|nr:hypothetical protein [Caldilineaceae bacterium]MCB9156218.1 hypothetical protein [Caldilineaceae bacterium]